MFNWNVINKTYVYDGSFDGLLTIVFDSFIKKVIPLGIVSKENAELNFLNDFLEISTDYEKSTRIFNGIVKNISYDTLYNSYYAFLSDVKDKEINILKYLLNGFVIGPKIDTMLSIDFVFNVHSMRKKMLAESHKLKGLLRFIEIKDNLFYASIHPSNNVIENLGHHFIRRLPTQNFIIHDKVRNIAFIFTTIAIKERTNPKLQMQFMPKKYWKDLIELN